MSDREIVAHALAGASWTAGSVTCRAARPSRPALALLEELHAFRRHASVPALLERLYDETRILAALTGSRRGEAQVANLEKVAALARGAAAQGALTLRAFTRLLEERITNAREEPDLPATRPGDPDTVRVLSIHKAKGLEAPVVALFDSEDEARPLIDSVPRWSEGRIALGFRGGCQPPGWDALVRREEKKAPRGAAAPALRRLHARARPARVAAPAGRRGQRQLLARGRPRSCRPRATPTCGSSTPTRWPSRRGASASPPVPTLVEGGDAVAARWREARRELIAAAAERPYQPISATRLAARTAPPAVGPAGGQAAGRDFGSLLHRLLQWVPLDLTPRRAGARAASDGGRARAGVRARRGRGATRGAAGRARRWRCRSSSARGMRRASGASSRCGSPTPSTSSKDLWTSSSRSRAG